MAVGDLVFKALTAGLGVATLYLAATFSVNVYRGLSWHAEQSVENVQRQLGTANKEQEALIEVFSNERKCRDQEEENLRKKLEEASSTIQDLLEQLNAARNYSKS